VTDFAWEALLERRDEFLAKTTRTDGARNGSSTSATGVGGETALRKSCEHRGNLGDSPNPKLVGTPESALM
jgi:hypothetical protein